jgi:hypothetical protein
VIRVGGYHDISYIYIYVCVCVYIYILGRKVMKGTEYILPLQTSDVLTE